MHQDFHPRIPALSFEHLDNLPRRAIAKQLPQSLLVVSNSMLLHQRDKVPGCIAGQRGFRKVGIGGKKVLGLAFEVRKVASSSTGDQNLFPDALSVFQHEHMASAQSRFAGAHQPRGAPTQDDDIDDLFPQSHRPPAAASAIPDYSRAHCYIGWGFPTAIACEPPQPLPISAKATSSPASRRVSVTFFMS